MAKDIMPSGRFRGLMRHRPGSVFDMMDEFWRKPFGDIGRFPFDVEEYPSINIKEEDNEINVTAELPGVGPGDIDVKVSQGRLTIKGEKKFEDEEKKDNYHRIERSYGCFQRTIALPSDVDESKVTASYKDGVLSLNMPKSAASKTIKVEVKSEE